MTNSVRRSIYGVLKFQLLFFIGLNGLYVYISSSSKEQLYVLPVHIALFCNYLSTPSQLAHDLSESLGIKIIMHYNSYNFFCRALEVTNSDLCGSHSQHHSQGTYL